jgi:hypothetical protein
MLHELNEVGTCLWLALEQPATPEQLVDVLVSEYAVSRTQAANDVAEFLHELTDRGLVSTT